MIKVRVIFDVSGWAYFHRARILQEFAPPDMEITIASGQERWNTGHIDILFDLNYGHTTEVRRQGAGRRGMIFMTSFNNGWKSRFEYFTSACNDCHAVVVNNHKYWDLAGRQPGTYHISNGVDRRTFVNKIPMKDRPLKMLWIGSDYHRGTKNYDTLLVPLKERLNGVIDADFWVRDPYGRLLTHGEMANWYNTGCIYVVASNVEGTPNPALEAASCGLAIVTTQVGNMPELIQDRVNGIFVEPTVDSLEAGVREAIARREELSANMEPAIAQWDWHERSQVYYKLFRDLMSGEAPLRRARE